MSEKKIIAAIGGDRRLVEAVRRFARDNTVSCYGWDNCPEICGSIKRCSTLEETVKNADIVILGLPCSPDGKVLAAPLCDISIRISDLTAVIPKDTVICGGMLPTEITENFCKCIDYYKDELLQTGNAVPTAEGAIMIAMQETPFTIDGSHCAVLGSGRIAKALVPRLKALNAEVTVAARKKTDRAYWETQGIKVCGFEKAKDILPYTDILFNTVPALVVGKTELDICNNNGIIIDLASRPGGVDFEYGKKMGKRIIWALSLPGKVAPVTAGRIIYNTVVTLLNEKGVMV